MLSATLACLRRPCPESVVANRRFSPTAQAFFDWSCALGLTRTVSHGSLPWDNTVCTSGRSWGWSRADRISSRLYFDSFPRIHSLCFLYRTWSNGKESWKDGIFAPRIRGETGPGSGESCCGQQADGTVLAMMAGLPAPDDRKLSDRGYSTRKGLSSPVIFQFLAQKGRVGACGADGVLSGKRSCFFFLRQVRSPACTNEIFLIRS